MSAKTWFEEFYPVTAQSIAQSGDDRAIILHAVQKWTGLLPENLEKHKVFFSEGVLEDNLRLNIDSSTCGLCVKYIDDDDDCNPCSACPLNKMLGHPCDEGDNDPNDGGIYWEALENPQVMIDALTKLL